MKLEHVALNVKQPQEMAAWYAKNLEMKIVRADTTPPYVHFLADKAGQSMIELYNHTKVNIPDYSTVDPLVLHLAFNVGDVEATRDRLVAAGAVPATDITTYPTGDKMIFLRDPWQITIQLIRRVKNLI